MLAAGATEENVTMDDAPLRAALAAGRTTLTEPEAKALVRAAGIPVPAGGVATTADAAAALVATIGPPVVVKIVSADITHKTEAGGVVYPVATAEEARRAFETVVARARAHAPGAAIAGVLVEAFRPGGVECVASLRMDRAFGPVIMFGLGGVLVEALGDVAFRLAPLGDGDADALLAEPRGALLLDGFRGKPAADRGALKRALEALSSLAWAPAIGPLIETVEINPLAAGADGVLALDALVTLKAGARP